MLHGAFYTKSCHIRALSGFEGARQGTKKLFPRISNSTMYTLNRSEKLKIAARYLETFGAKRSEVKDSRTRFSFSHSYFGSAPFPKCRNAGMWTSETTCLDHCFPRGCRHFAKQEYCVNGVCDSRSLEYSRTFHLATCERFHAAQFKHVGFWNVDK